MKIRKLTEIGNTAYREWIESRLAGQCPPEELLHGAEETEPYLDIEIDIDRAFGTRYGFGKYIADLLDQVDARELLAQKNDGFWNWLTIVYFGQFGRKSSKYWHYVVTRKGHSGSLAYRHLARTSFEMFWRHGEQSLVMLNVDMATWGDMSEQLTSRQDVAYNHVFIAAANSLYIEDGKLKRGAAGRVPPAKKRRKGDRRGRGGVARMALAVRRLCRTYDTHVLAASEMLQLLPREFGVFSERTVP